MPASAIAYDFLAPAQIRFGWGRSGDIGSVARALGHRAFLVTGSRTLAARGFVGELCGLLRASGVEALELATIQREPEVADVDRAVAGIAEHKPRSGDLVIGLGGGSAMDLAKAVAALATQSTRRSVADYLEGIGAGAKLESSPLPVLAMPTTAGTGSEATKNAVISSYDPPYKRSLRSDAMVPRAVIVDPQLTVSLPQQLTAQTGLDAITQLIESYISCRARPIPQGLAAEGLRRAVPALAEAVENGTSQPAREAMSHAALVSGMALANSGLGLAHGVAAALGSHFRVPHGLACAVMLPAALRFNRPACEQQLAELAHAAGIACGGKSDEAADDFVEAIEQLCQRLGLSRRLGELGVNHSHIPILVRASRGNSMDGNPRPVSDTHLAQIIEALL